MGTAFCADLAPEHFTIGAGRSRVLQEHAPASRSLLDAAEACPVLAVRILDAETGEQIAPLGG